ncbi:hypothetical protein BDY19DRAFT_957668 [Irpex rosettiformis]|uniref:Uncharacterized protein n=1 Tax=Irpex rosettiformis TaxID=378272 RepID=A0ACB8TY78_9APHY|nr:hypothetical protein BDY19DRAFT_957668 [Irpex rosettiformis]
MYYSTNCPVAPRVEWQIDSFQPLHTASHLSIAVGWLCLDDLFAPAVRTVSLLYKDCTHSALLAQVIAPPLAHPFLFLQDMLGMPSFNLTELKRAFHARTRSLSPTWSPAPGKSLLRKVSRIKVVEEPRQPQTYSLPWKVQPRGNYTPAEDRNTSYAYAADLTAELPATSSAMYILSEDDSLGAGAIHIYEDSEDKLVGSDLLVDIRVFYNSPQIQKALNISFVHNAPQNENGVRFRTTVPAPTETSARASTHDSERFVSINVRIPRATGSDPLKLPTFRTHLPNFVHSVGELAGSVHFSSISLSSSDRAIFVKSLSANKIRLRTSNGAIQGAFNSDSSISLRTANAPINAEVTLGNDGSGASNLELLTTFDEVRVDLSLTSVAPHGTQPFYRIHARSSEKPVDIISTSAPPNAIIQYEVQTTNAPASVTVPQSFDGAFALHSTPLKPTVTIRDQKEGEKLVQVRTLIYHRERRGLLEGRVVPQDGYDAGSSRLREGKESSVMVKTSNAEARLFL